MTQDQNRLNGWKSICAYLGASERRVVLSWGYPIHYERTGSVFALKAELDAHAANRPAYSRDFPRIPVS